MRSTTATRSIDDGDDGDKIERVELDRVRDRNSKPQNVESSARITTFPDTHGRSVCSSLNKSHNPANTHFLRSTMTAEFLPFSSVKMYATTKVKVPPQLQKTVC
ncbi:Uncharacterized protein Rs2_23597 [Raphanus sativus]|nr:Uncharacterized protein Rs2_23597 [Raphanus sativus]